MLRAGHLVASSGDGRDSFLLLDWRGCPPDPSTFPALTPKGSTVLSAIFKAFRFPSSPILKFSLILTICDGICQPVICRLTSVPQNWQVVLCNIHSIANFFVDGLR